MARYKSKKTQLKRKYGQIESSAIDSQQPPTSLLQETPQHVQHETDVNGDDWASYEELEKLALTRAEDFPPEMLKYWKQRHLLFSLFDGSSPSGQLPLLDREGWFSVTPEPIAARIAQRCRSSVVLDACCGAGGNAIQFAFTCERVIAIDTDLVKLRLARHNARIYGVDQYITFLHGDWREFARDWHEVHEAGKTLPRRPTLRKWQGCEQVDIDVVFLSPPWGGVNYRQFSSPSTDGQVSSPNKEMVADYYPLSALAPSGAHEMLRAATAITSNVCIFLPRNVNLEDLAALARECVPSHSLTLQDHESSDVIVDVEEQWLWGQCKALACYFGDLVNYVPQDGR